MKKTSETAPLRRSITFVLTLAFSLLLVMGGVFVVYKRATVAAHSSQTDKESLIVRSITTDDHIVGDVHAPIHLVVYTDLSCSFCKQFFRDTLPRLQATYGNTIAIAFRHLPLPSHPNSKLEALAAECVAMTSDNATFWRFVDAVYATNGYDKGLSRDTLIRLAIQVGASGSRVNDCLETGASVARVERDSVEAAVAGLNITPTVVLKSSTRALVVKGNYHSQLSRGVKYLLDNLPTQ